jgi:polyvinyl alcohol dehydrogenase (cytochrome)
VLALTLAPIFACSRKQAPPPDGALIFQKECEVCHRADSGSKAPLPDALRQMSKASILAALETGRMRWQGRMIGKKQREAVADYLASPSLSASVKVTGSYPRDLDPPPDPPVWTGWGVDSHNTRFQPARAAALSIDQVKNLKVKWAFGYPGASATYGQPTSYAGRLFVGSEDGTVYALDAATGCTWWTFHAPATVKTAVSIGNHGQAAFFGDTNGNVYAVAVSDGSLLWKVHPESHTAARITGSPLLVGSRLYVPISSGEEGAAADPKYPCLHISRKRRRARQRDRQISLEVVHHPASSAAHVQRTVRRPVLGTIRRRRVVKSHRRSGTANHLRGDWQQLFRSPLSNLRCGSRS